MAEHRSRTTYVVSSDCYQDFYQVMQFLNIWLNRHFLIIASRGNYLWIIQKRTVCLVNSLWISFHHSTRKYLEDVCNNGCPFIRFSHRQNQILIHNLIYGLIFPFRQSSLSLIFYLAKLRWQLLDSAVQIDSNSLNFSFSFFFQSIFVAYLNAIILLYFTYLQDTIIFQYFTVLQYCTRHTSK